MKGPLDTSNFDDFSGADDKFIIPAERHKACSDSLGRGPMGTLLYKDRTALLADLANHYQCWLLCSGDRRQNVAGSVNA